MKEIDYLRIYTGDTRIRNEQGCITVNKSEDPIWGDKNLYQTLNVLMFEGIENEVSRIKEGRKFNNQLIKKPSIIIDFYKNIYAVILQCKSNNPTKVYRVDRICSIEQLKKGYTRSFFSTSKKNYSSVFSNKDGIVLLEVTFEDGAIYGDVKEILKKEYLLEEEKEILVPPFTPIECKVEYTSKKNGFKDINREDPKAIGKIKVKKHHSANIQLSESEKSKIYENITDDDTLDKVHNALDQLSKQQINIEDINIYCKWKIDLQKYIEDELSLMRINYS